MKKLIKILITLIATMVVFASCEDPNSILKNAVTIKDGKVVQRGTKETPIVVGAVLDIFYDEDAKKEAQEIIGDDIYNREEVQKLIQVSKNKKTKPIIKDVFGIEYSGHTFYFTYDPSTVFGDGADFKTLLTPEQLGRIEGMFVKESDIFVLRSAKEKALKRSIDSLKKETAQELESAKTEVKKNQDALSNLIIEKTVATASFAEAKRNLDQITKDLEEARNKLAQSGSDNEALATEITAKEAELNTAKAKVFETENVIKGLSSAIVALESELKVVKDRNILSVLKSDILNLKTQIGMKMPVLLDVSGKDREDTNINTDLVILQNAEDTVNSFDTSTISGDDLTKAINTATVLKAELTKMLEGYSDLIEEITKEEEEEEKEESIVMDFVPVVTAEGEAIYSEIVSLVRELEEKGSALQRTIIEFNPEDENNEVLYISNKMAKAQKALEGIDKSEINTNKQHVKYLRDEISFIHKEQARYNEQFGYRKSLSEKYTKLMGKLYTTLNSLAELIKGNLEFITDEADIANHKQLLAVTEGQIAHTQEGIEAGVEELSNEDLKENINAYTARINSDNEMIKRFTRKKVDTKVDTADIQSDPREGTPSLIPFELLLPSEADLQRVSRLISLILMYPGGADKETGFGVVEDIDLDELTADDVFNLKRDLQDIYDDLIDEDELSEYNAQLPKK